jgi:hypothetical protein
MAAKGSIAGDSFTTLICRGLLDVIDDNRFDWSLINFRSAAFLGLTISDYPPSKKFRNRNWECLGVICITALSIEVRISLELDEILRESAAFSHISLCSTLCVVRACSIAVGDE